MLLAGEDRTADRGLPANELLAPLPLVALAVLALNDWVLKGSSAPPWLTGKLSDFAGLFVFPLVATAAFDLVLLGVARLGVPVDFTLRRWKLAIAIALTAGGFTAMKVSATVAAAVARVLGAVFGHAAVALDPTDLIALTMCVGTWLYGRRAIARGAYGRLELAQRQHAAGNPLTAPFCDAARCGADRATVEALDDAVAVWLAGGSAEPVDGALARLRAGAASVPARR